MKFIKITRAPRDHILYDFIYMKCPEWQIRRDRKQSGWLSGAERNDGLLGIVLFWG